MKQYVIYAVGIYHSIVEIFMENAR